MIAGSHDDAAADDAVVFVIKDGGLAGSGSADRIVESDPDAAVLLHFQYCGRSRVMIADLCPGAELFAGCHAGNGEEVYIAHFYNIAEEGRLVGEHDLIRPGTDFFYINGMAEGDAQAFFWPIV